MNTISSRGDIGEPPDMGEHRRPSIGKETGDAAFA